ncbi:unnamed protein product, partial [Meganyctiphanes norvegica]
MKGSSPTHVSSAKNVPPSTKNTSIMSTTISSNVLSPNTYKTASPIKRIRSRIESSTPVVSIRSTSQPPGSRNNEKRPGRKLYSRSVSVDGDNSDSKSNDAPNSTKVNLNNSRIINNKRSTLSSGSQSDSVTSKNITNGLVSKSSSLKQLNRRNRNNSPSPLSRSHTDKSVHKTGIDSVKTSPSHSPIHRISTSPAKSSYPFNSPVVRSNSSAIRKRPQLTRSNSASTLPGHVQPQSLPSSPYSTVTRCERLPNSNSPSPISLSKRFTNSSAKQRTSSSSTKSSGLKIQSSKGIQTFKPDQPKPHFKGSQTTIQDRSGQCTRGSQTVPLNVNSRDTSNLDNSSSTPTSPFEDSPCWSLSCCSSAPTSPRILGDEHSPGASSSCSRSSSPPVGCANCGDDSVPRITTNGLDYSCTR